MENVKKPDPKLLRVNIQSLSFLDFTGTAWLLEDNCVFPSSAGWMWHIIRSSGMVWFKITVGRSPRQPGVSWNVRNLAAAEDDDLETVITDQARSKLRAVSVCPQEMDGEAEKFFLEVRKYRGPACHMGFNFCQDSLISTPSQGLAYTLMLEVEIWVPGVPMQFEYWRQELGTYM